MIARCLYTVATLVAGVGALGEEPGDPCRTCLFGGVGR